MVSPEPVVWTLLKTMQVEFLTNTEGSSEELRLWADFYEATARVLEIMSSQGTTSATAVAQIVAEQAKAAGAFGRIKEIRGIKS